MRRKGNGWRAFACALRGLGLLAGREPHARVHLAATVLVVMLAIWLKCPPLEWALLALAIGIVWAAEGLNSAIERLADRVQPEREEAIRDVKDLAAGGVLAAALVALTVGLAVLGPRLLDQLFLSHPS